jgi:hypothetical protein
MREWPSWWSWELELSPHLLKRMVDRQFSEVDLRRMLEHAPRLRDDFGPRGNPIGIEITAPSKITLADINDLLESLELPPVEQADLAPLLAA